MFVWVDCAYLARTVANENADLVFIRIAWSITPFLFVLVYSFILNYLNKVQRYKIFTVISYIIGAVFLFITLNTSLIILGISFNSKNILQIIYGPLVWGFFGIVSFYTVVSYFILIKCYREKDIQADVKYGLRVMLIGLTVFFVANSIFNIIFPVFFKVFDLYEFGDYTTILFIALIAYATVRHSFFNVKTIVSTFLTVFLASFLLLDALLFSSNTTQAVIKGSVFLLYVPFGYLLVKSVLNEVKQREQLQILNKRLEDLDKQKDEFVSMAAHELRSPLTAIKGYVSMIIEGDTGDIPEKARQFLADAMAVTDRLVRLVNNMLDVSRIEEGRIVYQMEETSLIKAIQEAYYSFRVEAERKKLAFKLDIPNGTEDNVKVDPDRVQEVIGNFVSNAIKFTEKGSVDIVMSNPTPETVRVEVKDTGPGITKQEQEKLFQKFYRAETTSGKTFGTGLGLYITKLLIEKFGGKIGLVSEIDKGSNFWFELPVIRKA